MKTKQDVLLKFKLKNNDMETKEFKIIEQILNDVSGRLTGHHTFWGYVEEQQYTGSTLKRIVMEAMEEYRNLPKPGNTEILRKIEIHVETTKECIDNFDLPKYVIELLNQEIELYETIIKHLK